MGINFLIYIYGRQTFLTAQSQSEKLHPQITVAFSTISLASQRTRSTSLDFSAYIPDTMQSMELFLV